jgi:hypothetical protein
MRCHSTLVEIAVLVTLVLGASGQQRGGARELFFRPAERGSTDSDKTNASLEPADPSPRSTSPDLSHPTGTPGTATRPGAEAEHPGLMYWVELQIQDGGAQRVNTTREFRSGERVRLHLETNFDGRLAIFQKQDGESLTLLFPDKLVRNGDDKVSKRDDNVFPSEKSWFRFDSNPGKITLLVMLATEDYHDEILKPNLVQLALDQRKSVEIVERVRNLQGSKGLVVEVDDVSEQPATYIVDSAISEDEKSTGVIGFEIVLNHRQ